MRDVKGEDIYLNDETYINVAIDGLKAYSGQNRK